MLRAFLSHCAGRSPTLRFLISSTNLRPIIREILVEISKKKLVSTDLVKNLYLRSKFLLEHYSEFKPAQQPLIIGAVYYFALDKDASPDTEFATGFDDDAQVMNHVLEELGVVGQFIDYQKLGESSR